VGGHPRAELLRALGCCFEAPSERASRLAGLLGLGGPLEREAHTELLVLRCPPYAGFVLDPDGVVGGDGTDRVAGFFRAVAATPPPEPDHLASLLGLLAALVEADEPGGAGPRSPGPRRPAGVLRRSHDGEAQPSPARRARAVLVAEHLWSWLPPWFDAFAREASAIGSGPHRALARLLSQAVAAEGGVVGEVLGPEPPLPRALAEAPAPLGPGPGLLHGLLVPVRSGFLLTRADLARVASATGLGLRVGPRRLVLDALAAQDAPAVLGFLASEATRRARAYRRGAGTVVASRAVVRWWAERAASTARVLAQAADTAEPAADTAEPAADTAEPAADTAGLAAATAEPAARGRAVAALGPAVPRERPVA
jgi:hypothetical protein